MWEDLEKRWEDIRWADMSCWELRRVEKSCPEKAEICWDEMRRDEKSSGDMRREENSCDQLRRAEKGREDMRWDEMRWGEKNWEDMRWNGLRWDGMTQTRLPDCSENGMQWAIAKRSCDAMRSDEMGKCPTLKRHGVRLTSREMVAVKHKRLRRIL